MRANHVKKIVIHRSDQHGMPSLAERVSTFHTEIIERRLAACDLSSEQKRLVIDKILKGLKLREQNGLIK